MRKDPVAPGLPSCGGDVPHHIAVDMTPGILYKFFNLYKLLNILSNFTQGYELKLILLRHLTRCPL